MITKEQIQAILPHQECLDLTEELKSWLAGLRAQRSPFYLTSSEFGRVLEWKLDRQIGRQRTMRSANTDALIREVTKFALNIEHSDPEYQAEIRLGALCTLRGVGVPVASALLALSFPSQYTVIDFRVWRQLFDYEKSNFSISDYKKYLRKLKPLAEQCQATVQEIDHAVWEFDRFNPWEKKPDPA